MINVKPKAKIGLIGNAKLYINRKYVCDVDISLLNKEISRAYTDWSLTNFHLNLDPMEVINADYIFDRIEQIKTEELDDIEKK